MKKPELLIPASSLEVLKTAVIFGADAVYIGGEAFGLRAKAKNFTAADMKEGIAFAHKYGVRVHVTANILAHNDDLEGACSYFQELKALKPDALIIADPGMFMLARKICPEIDIHVSTQANNTNYMTYQFWQQQGAKRVVSARELSLKEIKEIRAHIPDGLEIESFIHGAMCISYSGRCLLSSYFTGRDANQGACTHPCRWKYAVVEEKRPGEYFPVYENERGTYIFNSKDLCMIGHIPEKYRANMDWYLAEISKCTYRQFTTGFYFGKPDESTQIYDNNTYVSEYIYLGIVGSLTRVAGEDCVRIEQRNKFSVGDAIEIMKPDGTNVAVEVLAMYDEQGRSIESCPHSRQIIDVKLSRTPDIYDILRVEGSR